MDGLTKREKELLGLLKRKALVQRTCLELRAEIDRLEHGLKLNETELSDLVRQLEGRMGK